METSRRGLLGTAAAVLATGPAVRTRAQQRPKVRIGVLTDLTGSYRDATGITSVLCAQQALEDFGVSGKGLDVEVLIEDHKNKPDRAVAIARRWFEHGGVDVVADVPSSPVALAVAEIAQAKDKILLDFSATTTALTGQQCSPNTIVWSFDSYMLAKSSGAAAVQAGSKDWFFITADNAFGRSLEEQTTDLVTKGGGSVRGRARYPFPGTVDFSPLLQQAQASGAKVLGLANAGLDTVNAISQAHELGLRRFMQIAPLLMYITDVHTLGLDVAAGLMLTETFYWDLNDRTRAFTERVRPKTRTNWPNMAHASAYSGTLHYLKVVAEMGAGEAKRSGAATVARMKQMPTDDDAFGQGGIRQDGRGMFPAYLFRVKTPEESRGAWDTYMLVDTTPATEALRPLGETGCRLVST